MSNRIIRAASRSGGALWVADAVIAVALAAALSCAVTAAQHAERSAFILSLGGLCGAAILRAALQVVAAVDGQRAAERAKAAWRARVWPAALTMPPGDRTMLGEAVADGVDRIEDLNGYHAQFLPLRFAAVAAPLLIALAAAPASWVAAAILIGTLIPFGFGMALAGTAAARAAHRQLEALGRLSGLFVDRVRALPVIVGFGAQDRVSRHLEQATRDVAVRTLAVLRVAFVSGAVIEFFAALSVALVAVYCGFNLLGLLPFPAPETLTLGQALFVLVLAPEFYLPMRRLAAAYHDKQTGEAAMERLDMRAAPTATVRREPLVAPPAISFDHVVITRGDARIGPLSFSVPAGAMTAIRGPSGAGKSSILHALLGLAPLASGRILVDGEEAAPGLLPGRIGWAGQSVALLPGTLADNIRAACPSADDAVVEAAARRAGLGPLIAARGQGISLPLDHRGSGLSGGERRRIGIARVLLKDAPLWLLDEPTADLDMFSAASIAETLKAAAKGRTVLLATHSAELAALAGEEIVLA